MLGGQAAQLEALECLVAWRMYGHQLRSGYRAAAKATLL